MEGCRVGQGQRQSGGSWHAKLLPWRGEPVLLGPRRKLLTEHQPAYAQLSSSSTECTWTVSAKGSYLVLYRFEDGTISFLDVIALKHGFDALEHLTGQSVDMFT